LASVELRGLTKRFGSLAVVDNVSLKIDHGQLVCLLGPSGCGKTTTLRLIAGFLEPSDGEIHVGERLVSSKARTLPPEQRSMSMIFQSYALWPHMTVTENIVYGLRLRKLDRDSIAKKLAAILATTKLEPLAQRYPGELSGGQQQRVALARALIVEPETLLLDEPLSNLDAKVRVQLRSEIKSLQNRLGFTAIHVTHDREEAMTMADRIVVMDAGHIAQVGAPKEVYDHPVSPFVASFMGAENVIELDVRGASGGIEVKAAEAQPVRWTGDAPVGPVTAYFRDDVARLDAPDAHMEGAIVLPGRITQRTYPGGHYRYAIAIGERHFTVTDDRYLDLETPVGLRLPLDSLHLFPSAHNKGGHHA
jgi:ABC-type Fe3+/spermidine/putrescine transport system ATPase subunit